MFLATTPDAHSVSATSITTSASTAMIADNDVRPTTSRCEYGSFNDVHLLCFLLYTSFDLFLRLFSLRFAGRCNIGKYALHGTVRTQQYASEPTDVDVYEYIRDNANDVRHRLDAAIQSHSSIKWYGTIDIAFSRTTPDGDLQHTTARFRTQPDVISDTSDVTADRIANEFLTGIENFGSRGSNWVVESVLDFRITYAPFRPAQGTSFIATPREIAVKKAIINVQNLNDEKCFLYSVLAALHPVDHKNNPSRTHHYRTYLNELNTDGLLFPLPVKDVPKFENQNSDISVSVLTYEDRELMPLYVSPHRNRKHTVHLLLLCDETTQHYTLVKNLSRLVAGRTKHDGKTHVCPYCFHCFRQQHVLDKHIPDCSTHTPQTVTYPKEGEDAVLYYKSIQKEFPVPYVLYVDFESFLIPSADKDSVNEHVPSGFCCLKVSKFDDEMFEPYVYSGPDTVSKFYEHIYREQETICTKLNVQMDMSSLTDEEKSQYENASTCPNCNSSFDQISRIKVRHHCHTTGRFLGAVCAKCNLQLKYRKRKQHNNRNDEFFIPVIAHNMKNYDSHLIIKGYERSGSHNISVIPSNTEKFLAFQIGKLRFLDSFQFLAASLEKLVKSLPTNAFKFISKFSPAPHLVKQKGVYPYEYMTDLSKFDEPRLPPKDKFYSALGETDITDEDYNRARDIWNVYECKTMKDFHDAYLTTDVLLLADVFENFRSICMHNYGLDPAHFYTTPGLSFQACLKMTGTKLGLFTDPEKHMFIENNIKGGVSMISNRYAKANNKYTDDRLDSTRSTSFVSYLDANNLYGYAMSQPLPTGNFRFLTEDEIEHLDILNVPDDYPMGYILEVDMEYPHNLHELHNDYPLAPEKLLITKEMLSPYAQSFRDQHVLSEKLVPNLNDKTKYVTHYVNLKLYTRLGMRLRRIHRILEFTQRPWIKPYIDFNTEKRRQATTDFERDFYKLMNNSVFGKTIENLRNRMNVNLVNDQIKAKKLIALPTFKHLEIINPDLVMIHRLKAKIHQNKPIYTGYSILELSKAHMYRFHYDVMLAKYGLNCRLLFTDTDSFCYSIQTDDLYDDMTTFSDHLDTSSYPKEHPLYSSQNAKVLGKFKDECNGTAPLEFVGLRSKMYSLLVSREQTKMTAKGVKKSYIEKHVTHNMFLHTLQNKTCTIARYLNFRSRNHIIKTQEIDKICLSAYDDKRFLLWDGKNSLAYGHKDIT